MSESSQVRVILNVENWSRYTMLDSQTDIHCGSVLKQFSATNVYPGYRETQRGSKSYTRSLIGQYATLQPSHWLSDSRPTLCL